MGLSGFEDFMAGHHHAEVDDVVVVALQHHAHDVLADIVYVAFNGGHEDAPFGGACRLGLGLFLGFEVGQEVGDGFFHDARAFHHLWEEHFAGSEEVSYHVHAGHQGAFDELKGSIELLTGFFCIGIDVFIESFYEGVGKPLLYGQLPPLLIAPLGLAPGFAFEAPGEVNQSFGCVGPSVEKHIFYMFEEFGFDLFVDFDLSGVHDAHIHTCGDGVVEEGGVHGFADFVVASEAEADVAHASAHAGAG